ncbi:hypothetical protein BDV12DRAFT_201125 [Aspergillus spectabilis]
MSLTNLSRPTLQRTLTTPILIQAQKFSIAIPSRIATEYRPPKLHGYLAEKGPFPFRERAPSYESVRLQNTGVEGEGEFADVETLKRKVVEQRRTIEALQRTM